MRNGDAGKRIDWKTGPMEHDTAARSRAQRRH
jgi:hypothetical protein